MTENKEKSSPLVSIVVVTLNNSEILRNCLNSLMGQDYSPFEIIVVDNGSQEDIRGIVEKAFPEVHLIKLEKNYGFSGGNNRGIEESKGKYIALINNDAVASPQWLSALVAAAESDSRIGAVASIIIDGNQPDILDSCGVGIALDGMSRQAMPGMPVPNLTGPKEVLAFSGCTCLLRKEALEEVGLFDEDFFAYCEDTDLSLRLRWSGWKIVAAPNSNVHHYYSMTGGKFSLQKIYWVERNHFWVAIKNFPWPLLIILPFVTLWRYLLQLHLLLTRNGELSGFIESSNSSSIVSVYLKALLDMCWQLPLMLRKRQTSYIKRHLGTMDMLALIHKFHLPVKAILLITKQFKKNHLL